MTVSRSPSVSRNPSTLYVRCFKISFLFLCFRLRAMFVSPRCDNRLNWSSWLNGLDIMLSDAFGCRATVKYMI